MASSSERERLLGSMEALTKKQVPLCCLGLVSEGPCTLAAERFAKGKVQLSEEFDYLPSEAPLRRIEEAWLEEAEQRYMPKHRDGSDSNQFQLPAKEYVEIILSHKPTLRQSFNHILTTWNNDPSRLPSRVSEAQLVEAVQRLKAYNAKAKQKRKRKRRLSSHNDGKGRIKTYYQGDKEVAEKKAKKAHKVRVVSVEDGAENAIKSDKKEKKKKKKKKEEKEKGEEPKEKKKKKKKKA